MATGNWDAYVIIALLGTSYALFEPFKITHYNQCSSTETPFRIFYGKSLIECVSECDIRQKCDAINYRIHRLQCEILESGDSTTFVSTSYQIGECVYIEKKHMFMNAFACCGNNCTRGEACNTESGKCIIKECHPLSVNNGILLGNMWAVGSRLKLKCNDGYAAVDEIIYTKCNTSGQWDPLVSCLTTDRCVSSPCLNGGACADAIDKYTCTCASGYEGDTCQTELKECATNPCLNGGVCEDGVNAYTCTFDFEFGGENYETNCTYAIGGEVLMCTNPDIHTLRIYKNELPQSNAAGDCDSIGWQLVKIDTLRKQEFIRNLLKAIQEFLNKDYWIDGSNDYAGVAWRFADGTIVPMTQGDFWENHAPNSPDVEHCVRMREDAHHLWNDMTCSETNGYICEIP